MQITWAVIIGIYFCSAPPAPGVDREEPPPPVSPLEARLVANGALYQLSARHRGDTFRRWLADPNNHGQLPPSPHVDLVLELENTGARPTNVVLGSDAGRIMLELVGPGAVSIKPRQAFTREYRHGKVHSIAAGESFRIPIHRLQYGFRGREFRAYWTEPGEYTLTATFDSPPPGSPGGGLEPGHVVRTPPLELVLVAP